MRLSHLRVAAGEEWETAMQVRVVGCLFARVRRARKVFWATVVLFGQPCLRWSWGWAVGFIGETGKGRGRVQVATGAQGNVQAQPTQRRNTIRTFFPPPKANLRSRSRGAGSPGLGQSAATGMGGGGGESQGWTVRGRDLTVIQAGQVAEEEERESSRSRPGTVPGGADLVSFLGLGSGAAVGDRKSRLSLLRPSLRRAILVVMEENMMALVMRLSVTLGSGFGPLRWVVGRVNIGRMSQG